MNYEEFLEEKVVDYQFTEFVFDRHIMNTKKWYQSKTLWFNVVVFIVGFVSLPEFVQLLPAELLPVITLVGVAGNMILRIWFTEMSVTK